MNHSSLVVMILLLQNLETMKMVKNEASELLNMKPVGLGRAAMTADNDEHKRFARGDRTGSAHPMLTSQDVSEANKFVKEITNLKPTGTSMYVLFPFLVKCFFLSILKMQRNPRPDSTAYGGLSAEVCYHKFHPQLNKFYPLHFFSGPDSGIIQENCSCSSYSINTVGIIRAPCGDGKEAIVLVTPYNSVNVSLGEALSLGIASLEQKYLMCLDVLEPWLLPLSLRLLMETMKLRRKPSGIYAEASNGQMPNLDLINVVSYLAVHGQGLRVKVEKFSSLLDSKWLSVLGERFESLGKVARSLNPQWKFGMPVADYIEGTATLASSLYHQALGVPTGPHGAFRDYQVDAITLEISPIVSSNKGRQNEFLLQGGRSIGVLRSVNNLLEKFHQSFFLYLLTSPIINFATAEIGALLIVPMCLMATPLRFELKARSLRSITRAACNLVLAFIGFPPNAYVISKGLFEGFGIVNVGDFWNCWKNHKANMDTILCDELLQYIFQRLPPPSPSAAVSLVSKRWLRLYRSSKTDLSLRLSSPPPPLSSFLSHFPVLSFLSLTSGGDTSTLSDHFLLSAVSSCPNLRHLRLLTGPVSPFSLLSLSTSSPHLTSLSISLSRPLSFHWLLLLSSLKDLSIVFSSVTEDFDSDRFNSRNCKKLKKLQLRSCEVIGDDSDFVKCLQGLQEVELRTCRTIIDEVLLKLAENCTSLKSLLVYDGGSREGLLKFINQTRCSLQKLDFRIPLDLENNHLLAMAENFRGLSSLRLQSCCLVTGEGLKTIGIAMSDGLEELGLINCDVVEREPGLLTTLGQNLRHLRKLDLSYNEMLVDKELTSMLASCISLSELRLRGCKGLTNAAIVSMFKSCKHLEIVDIMHCCGIEPEAVELFLLNCRQLRQVQVEESKLSDAARSWASNKFIEVVV
ncbi:hypothetical protein HYC85_005891 [Camellia sinensis]|uniref:F-box domain-containing protein n=1 Tax=Camellia sinensis TaxID=4442 RepID=A0A7J7I2H5_CAMSI|nr:hypothetical protein HYC85_005891 [Camellia sinensis]